MVRHYSSRGAGFGPWFLWNDFCIAADLTGDGTVGIRLEARVLKAVMLNSFSAVREFIYLWSS